MENFLISGAASEIAVSYIKQHPQYHYILIDLPKQEAFLADQLEEIHYKFYGIDLQVVKDIEDLFRTELSSHPLHRVLNLQGVNFLAEAIDTDEQIWDFVVDTNLKSAFFVMKEAAKNMILHDIAGRMVSVASQHGLVANFYRAAYCASKAGLIHLTKALAVEWERYGIRVNTLSPGFIVNSKNKDFLLHPSKRREYLEKIPLHRYATIEDIIPAISFLMNESMDYLTGHNLVLDGGWTIV